MRENSVVRLVSAPSPGWVNVGDASASDALVQISRGTNLHLERRFMSSCGETHDTGGVWVSCASPQNAASAERLAQAPHGGQSRAPRHE